jgi:epoxyqueuosine reductase
LTISPAASDKLVEELRARAEKLGFDAFGITSANIGSEMGDRLETALDKGWHGDMDWMAETAARRVAPTALWPDARSVIMLGVNYGPDEDPMPLLEQKTKGNISVYARNRDYHDIIKGKLKELAGLVSRRAGAEVKVFVDTAPVMEKPLAEAAGIGWQGKHTVLVSREFGSWLFLGAIFTSAELPTSEPHKQSCGTCRKCLDICPTDAFPASFQLDARKCLAYLNIELKSQIPRAYRAPMGNRIYGCDDCLAVCPWNKFAKTTNEAKLAAREDLKAPDLSELAVLSDADFRKRFTGSPVKRLGRDRFVRNVLIALGNSEVPQLATIAETQLDDDAPLVRGAAIWALRRLKGDAALEAVRRRHLDSERDAETTAEWDGDITPRLPKA